MKHIVRLSIILFSILALIGCGQSNSQTDEIQKEVETATDAVIHTTEMKEKALFVSRDVEKEISSENKEEKAEEVEENNESATEESSTVVQTAEDKSGQSETTAASKESKTAPKTKEENKKSGKSEGKANTESKKSDSSKTTNKKQQENQDEESTNKNNASESKEKSPPPEPPKQTVTVKVESPSDLNGPNMGPITVEIEDGETIYTATVKAIGADKIQKSGSGAMLYVSGIGNLKEFDAGPLSGWNVYVNGTIISKSSDAHEVSNGDSILWKYTENYLEY